MRPSASATHMGDTPNGFARCFQAKWAAVAGPGSHPRLRSATVKTAGRSSSEARRTVTSGAGAVTPAA